MTIAFLETYYKVVGNTSVAVNDNVVEVQLPTLEKFTLDSKNPAFDRVEDALGVSGKLYLYSGEFLTLLAPENKYESQILISAFVTWMLSDTVQEKSMTYMSWDHATSLRIESLIFIRQVYPELWPSNGDELVRVDLEWCLQLSNIKLNNHGVFVLRSLLLASKCLPDPEFFQLKKQVTVVFAARMSQILDYVYGSDGWCAENSPMYDRVWINLLKQLQHHFIDQIREADLTVRFESILEKADLTSRAQLYHGGHYVSRGDTPRMKTSLRPVRGNHFSLRVGIWIHSSEDLYLMATAGHASVTHKHVDDTQLLMSYKGVDFFIDGGGTSYDYSDPRIPAIKSMAGHSVLSEAGIDQLPPWRAYSGDIPQIAAQMKGASENEVNMEIRLASGGKLQRSVKVAQDALSVRDEWDLARGQKPITRYLLPETCFIEQQDKKIILYRLGQSVTLTFDQRISAEIVSGENKPPYRGWYSLDARIIKKGYCLEITPEQVGSTGALNYDINMAPTSVAEQHSLTERAQGALGGKVSPANAISVEERTSFAETHSPDAKKLGNIVRFWQRGIKALRNFGRRSD